MADRRVAPGHRWRVRLTVLGSGSRGNALVVEAGGVAILVDAGFPLRDLEVRCELAGFDPRGLAAVALTHEHGDHARGVARAAQRWGLTVAASPGTLAALAATLPERTPRVVLPPARRVPVGGFTITAFPTAHDATDPVMLVIEDGGGRRIGVAYDVGSPTTALRHACRGLDALVIEANHDEVLLRASAYPPTVRARIAGRGGHLSNRQAGELAAAVAHPDLGLLVLAHLSDRCNRPDVARATVEAALRGSAFAGRIVVATQDAPTPALEVGAAQLPLPLGLG